ncbi:hypothetical protein CBW24_07980 [Pacificitalea manganoxidans]|uniref:Minor tail protein Z (GPZ) n=1 Tax=Pacificitalea manganoxidans TaxID=1411902 RepID=A0A291LZ91_9RHOB|nr:phage tail protein [Pacificitalea manganoxidans]ATI41947.1 hypothetical protein CBW24_07980 [Pacificitalea manganoxidans]MDR6309435.1 hypothetical protein [Pacificitalea manganoxidans]
MIELDLDPGQLRRIGAEFGASEQDLRRAFARALSRTARSLRSQARQALRQGLGLRAASVLKARLKLDRLRAQGNRMGAAQLWVGTNDLRADAFKGKPRRGAGGAQVGGHSWPAGFVARGAGSGKVMVFERRGRARLPIEVATEPVHEEMVEILDRQVFAEARQLVMKNFRAEVKTRTIYKVGR